LDDQVSAKGQSTYETFTSREFRDQKNIRHVIKDEHLQFASIESGNQSGKKIEKIVKQSGQE
jgi:hypothetical protein